MEKPERRAILVAMLESQDLGDKSKTKVLECFDNETIFEDARDPLSTFIFDAITQGGDAEDIASNIGYAITQMTKAQNAIKQPA